MSTRSRSRSKNRESEDDEIIERPPNGWRRNFNHNRQQQRFKKFDNGKNFGHFRPHYQQYNNNNNKAHQLIVDLKSRVREQETRIIQKDLLVKQAELMVLTRDEDIKELEVRHARVVNDIERSCERKIDDLKRKWEKEVSDVRRKLRNSEDDVEKLRMILSVTNSRNEKLVETVKRLKRAEKRRECDCRSSKASPEYSYLRKGSVSSISSLESYKSVSKKSVDASEFLSPSCKKSKDVLHFTNHSYEPPEVIVDDNLEQNENLNNVDDPQSIDRTSISESHDTNNTIINDDNQTKSDDNLMIKCEDLLEDGENLLKKYDNLLHASENLRSNIDMHIHDGSTKRPRKTRFSDIFENKKMCLKSDKIVCEDKNSHVDFVTTESHNENVDEICCDGGMKTDNKDSVEWDKSDEKLAENIESIKDEEVHEKIISDDENLKTSPKRLKKCFRRNLIKKPMSIKNSNDKKPNDNITKTLSIEQQLAEMQGDTKKANDESKNSNESTASCLSNEETQEINFKTEASSNFIEIKQENKFVMASDNFGSCETIPGTFDNLNDFNEHLSDVETNNEVVNHEKGCENLLEVEEKIQENIIEDTKDDCEVDPQENVNLFQESSLLETTEDSVDPKDHSVDHNDHSVNSKDHSESNLPSNDQPESILTSPESNLFSSEPLEVNSSPSNQPEGDLTFSKQSESNNFSLYQPEANVTTSDQPSEDSITLDQPEADSDHQKTIDDQYEATNEENLEYIQVTFGSDGSLMTLIPSEEGSDTYYMVQNEVNESEITLMYDDSQHECEPESQNENLNSYELTTEGNYEGDVPDAVDEVEIEAEDSYEKENCEDQIQDIEVNNQENGKEENNLEDQQNVSEDINQDGDDITTDNEDNLQHNENMIHNNEDNLLERENIDQDNEGNLQENETMIQDIENNLQDSENMIQNIDNQQENFEQTTINDQDNTLDDEAIEFVEAIEHNIDQQTPEITTNFDPLRDESQEDTENNSRKCYNEEFKKHKTRSRKKLLNQEASNTIASSIIQIQEGLNSSSKQVETKNKDQDIIELDVQKYQETKESDEQRIEELADQRKESETQSSLTSDLKIIEEPITIPQIQEIDINLISKDQQPTSLNQVPLNNENPKLLSSQTHYKMGSKLKTLTIRRKSFAGFKSSYATDFLRRETQSVPNKEKEKSDKKVTEQENLPEKQKYLENLSTSNKNPSPLLNTSQPIIPNSNSSLLTLNQTIDYITSKIECFINSQADMSQIVAMKGMLNDFKALRGEKEEMYDKIDIDERIRRIQIEQFNMLNKISLQQVNNNTCVGGEIPEEVLYKVRQMNEPHFEDSPEILTQKLKSTRPGLEILYRHDPSKSSHAQKQQDQRNIKKIMMDRYSESQKNQITSLYQPYAELTPSKASQISSTAQRYADESQDVTIMSQYLTNIGSSAGIYQMAPMAYTQYQMTPQGWQPINNVIPHEVNQRVPQKVPDDPRFYVESKMPSMMAVGRVNYEHFDPNPPQTLRVKNRAELFNEQVHKMPSRGLPVNPNNYHMARIRQRALSQAERIQRPNNDQSRMYHGNQHVLAHPQLSNMSQINQKLFRQAYENASQRFHYQPPGVPQDRILNDFQRHSKNLQTTSNDPRLKKINASPSFEVEKPSTLTRSISHDVKTTPRPAIARFVSNDSKKRPHDDQIPHPAKRQCEQANSPISPYSIASPSSQSDEITKKRHENKKEISRAVIAQLDHFFELKKFGTDNPKQVFKDMARTVTYFFHNKNPDASADKEAIKDYIFEVFYENGIITKSEDFLLQESG